MNPKNPHQILILNDTETRRRKKTLARAVHKTMVVHQVPSCDIRVLLTTNQRVGELNHQFRGRQEPTDVLTFASPNTVERGHIDGDIAISVDMARQQARRRGASLQDELAMLAIHGSLHLLGFDDESDSDRAKMVSAMNEIAQACGLPGDQDWWSRHYGEVSH